VDNELEVIRNQMEQTRSSLADKLETLENEVRGTVEGATNVVANTVETVQSTVENVKEGVQDAVETVKETFNVRKHVERHPWAMFGGAFMAGCLAGTLLGRSRKSAAVTTTAKEPAIRHGHRNGHSHGNGASRKAAAASTEEEESGPLYSGLKELKGLAIGTLMGALRDVIVKAAPSNLASELAGVVDDMTTRLGGKTLRCPEETNETCTEEGGTHNVGSDVTEMGRSMGATRWSR
jgi:ElaB/YqjD/DUF883 family membrane-anchored ribosome-binding protein